MQRCSCVSYVNQIRPSHVSKKTNRSSKYQRGMSSFVFTQKKFSPPFVTTTMMNDAKWNGSRKYSNCRSRLHCSTMTTAGDRISSKMLVDDKSGIICYVTHEVTCVGSVANAVTASWIGVTMKSSLEIWQGCMTSWSHSRWSHVLDFYGGGDNRMNKSFFAC